MNIKQKEFNNAILLNNIKEIKILLTSKDVNPDYNNSKALICASRDGFIDIVKLLLMDTRVHPSGFSNSALCFAAEAGNIDIMKLLLKDNRVLPFEQCNYAIISANDKNKIKAVKLLWKKPEVKRTLKKDNIELYNKLKNKDIKDKLLIF